MLLMLGLVYAPVIKADLLQSLYSVFGSAGKAACEAAADGLSMTPLRACSANDTLASPADLFCRFSRSDCNAAYVQAGEVVDCLADPLACSRQAFSDACELAGNACGLAHDAMNAMRGCFSTTDPCAEELLVIFGEAGLGTCQRAADLVPALPPSRNQCDLVYARFDEVNTCLLSNNKPACLVTIFEERCVSAARLFPHSANDCSAVSSLANQTIETVEQCLAEFLECPEDLLQQLKQGVVRLQGRIVDEQQQPLAGVMVSATPISDDLLQVSTSTHVALSDGDGRWRIDINPAFSFKGDYRVNATGALHDFFAINNMPRFDYVVTVE